MGWEANKLQSDEMWQKVLLLLSHYCTQTIFNFLHLTLSETICFFPNTFQVQDKYLELYFYVDFEQFLISFFQQVVPVLCGQVWRSLKTKTMPQSHRRPVQSRSASVSAKSKHKSNLRDQRQAILGPILKMNFFYWWFFEKKEALIAK